MRQHVPIHEGKKALEINRENGPWVSEGQTGESKIEERIKGGMCGRRRVHAVNGAF